MRAMDLEGASMKFEQQQISALVERYENGIPLFDRAVCGASASEIDKISAPGKWTIRQISCHIADSEAVAAVRYRMIAAQPGSSLSAFDQELWAEHLVYSKQPWEVALGAFAATRRYNCAMLRALPVETWSRTAVHVERGEHTLYKMVEHNAQHLENHAGQVTNIRQNSSSAGR